jgi:uncharacterized repeat protein (TIGR03803 family)
MKSRFSVVASVAAIVSVAVFLSGSRFASSQEKVLYSFGANDMASNGTAPKGRLILDSKGNLYGTTYLGGPNAAGTAFELIPGAGGAWTEKILYNFGAGSTDGANPTGALVFDSKGNLYGTTSAGGAYTTSGSQGTVFELTPSTGGKWTEQVLCSFGATATDASYPTADVVFDSKGNLYGTASQGGANGKGAVFELTPASAGSWTEKVIYSFGANSNDGFSPMGDLIVDAKGNLYGTTKQGGSNGKSYYGAGTVFELSPVSSGDWTEKVLYDFGVTTTDASEPLAGLLFDSKGNLYGATNGGGANDSGTVFKLTPTASGPWTETILFSFNDLSSTAGESPQGNLAFDAAGNLYGTTYATYAEDGTIFELSPAATPPWTETELHIFSGSPDGATPASGLVFDNAGNLYGTTPTGGTIGGGAVYEFIPAAKAATPTFTPGTGTYTAVQSVEIKDSTPDAKIYYTTNGTAPTTSSTEYTGAVTVDRSETIEAIAVAAGYDDSLAGAAHYTIDLPATDRPVISPAAGTYTTPKTIAITDATSDAIVYYTTSGATPTSASTKYTAPFKLSASAAVKAIAIASEHAPSSIASAIYTIETPAATPVFSPKAGAYTTSKTITITDATAGATIYYTVNDTIPTTKSTKYTAPFKITATAVVKAIAVATGHGQSATAAAEYIIETPTATPVFSLKAATYTTPKALTITDAIKGAVIYYTTNGKTPTTSSTKYTAAIKVSASETVEAIAIAPLHTASATAKAKYIIETPAAKPVFSPAAGTYNAAQTVAIKSATKGAIIYYTTNGKTPTSASTKYTAAITVSASETIKAIAVAPEYDPSIVASAAYTIGNGTATPVISPVAGTYNSPLTVTISDLSAGAAIYYTTDDSTPTASSTKYTSAGIQLTSSGTVKAIAIASGKDPSAVASVAYTVEIILP